MDNYSTCAYSLNEIRWHLSNRKVFWNLGSKSLCFPNHLCRIRENSLDTFLLGSSLRKFLQIHETDLKMEAPMTSSKLCSYIFRDGLTPSRGGFSSGYCPHKSSTFSQCCSSSQWNMRRGSPFSVSKSVNTAIRTSQLFIYEIHFSGCDEKVLSG